MIVLSYIITPIEQIRTFLFGAAIMFGVRHIFTLPLAFLSFLSVFYSVGKLMIFLSHPINIQPGEIHQSIQRIFTAQSTKIWLAMAINAILIILFMLVHSFMRSETVKSLCSKLNLSAAERSIYNLSTAITIIILIDNWQRIASIRLWSFELETNSIMYWSFISLHAASWIIIYGGCVIMDFPELIGIKQVSSRYTF